MVFEEQVAYYLDKYLGKFVKGLSKDALKISVWAGNVELTNMQLKPEALNALKLPIKVKAGFLGSVKLKIPWSRLGQEPVVVFLDRIFLLAEPATNVDGGDAGDAVQEAKMKRVTEAERKLVEARGEEAMKQEVANTSWLGSLISTIIGNLKLSISNIHIRYEDLESHPGHPFAAGVTLEKLAAVTVDENGKETFVTGGSLDRIQKSAELQRLAVYFDPDNEPWKVHKSWEDLRPNEWTQIFVPGIKSEQSEGSKGLVKQTHSYILQPVGGNARYYKLANKDHRTPDTPAQKAVVMLDDVTVGLSEAQYRDGLKVAENFSTFNKRLQYAHFRPSVPMKEDKRAWWQYAFKAVAEQQKQGSGHVSWSRVVRLSGLRKKYVSLYVSSLQSGKPDRISVDDNEEIRSMDRELDTDLIVQWRMMAHSFVDSTRAKEEKKKQQNNSWWSWWGGGESAEVEPEARFTDEDLEKFNQLIGYQEGQRSNILRGQEPPNMLHTILEVRMRRNATKLVAQDTEELLELSADDLQCILHMYPKTMRVNVKLGSYQVECPEGLLAESATKTEAITATFTYLPNEMDLDSSGDQSQKLDWSLAAKASPCYATVLMKSVNKVIKFFQSSKAVSRSVALDTATALQTTLDEVARNAQQQINQALKDRPRFSIDLDLAAPKVTIPTEFYPDGEHKCNLLVDLGYFSFQTEPDEKSTDSTRENELYMRFRMKLTDVSAILVDGEHDWTKDYDDVSGDLIEKEKNQKRDTYLSVLDRCGMAVSFQQICVPHPDYPTTRVALRLPSLGFHFSPARYHRLMEVLKVFQSSPSENDDGGVRPWEPSDFEGEASVLAWKGVGHREAVWQHRHAILTGPFLYLLDDPNAQTYKYCSSLIGKQVSAVPPESVGDVPYVLAVCDAGQFNNKVAESVNALLLRFEDESSMARWQSRLTGAIYRTSAPAAIASLVGSNSQEDDPKAAIVAASESTRNLNSSEQESFFLIGVLDELKIVIYNSNLDDYTSKQILLERENRLLEFRAIGTKVEFAMKTYDMSVGAVLQALEIEDKLNGHASPSCKYLARSYIKTPKTANTPRMNGKANNSGRRRTQNLPPLRHGKKKLASSESDRFFDAEEDLDSEDSSTESHRYTRSWNSLSKFFDAEEGDVDEPPTFERTAGLLPVIGSSGKDREVIQDEGLKNFVKVQVIMCSQESPDYADVDKQVTATLSTLSFFCNRRTLLALLDLVTAITAEVAPQDPDPPLSSTESDAIVTSINPKAIDDRGQGDESNADFHRNDSVVKGLLGKGKSRIVFLVAMNMDRVQVVLNLEDGNQLSILSLADLHTDIKVFPTSFGIKAALGNLQVSDGSLEENHPYHYICNMRDPDGASFISLEFLSFNKEDDDYEGFDYSIMGKLSEVRIVFLYRFVQEILNYFMGLVPKNSGYVVKLKDRVTDVEKFFDQSEIEGQPAMKLGLSLNKPVIIMPRSTASTDFLELDILHINLYNNFQWLGGDKDELGAVRLETTTLELEDLHLVVGVNGQTGEGIIQEARGLALVVRRPIRDLWHQLPAAEASIRIEELRAALSDKEYQVITECATSNMAEAPTLPPPVIESGPHDDKNEDQQEVETIIQEPSGASNRASNPPQSGDNESSREDSWTTVKVGVGINMVELKLFTGQSRESPLAAIQVTGVWASYKSNTLQESNIQATLEKFSVRDDREGTEAEMRYMIGNADDAEPISLDKKAREEEGSGKHEKGLQKDGSCSRPDCRSALTMLVLDAKIAPQMQVVSMRIQRPRLLVALDFLLAVAEFFIPSMHAMLSDGKGSNENPLEIQNAIFLKEKVYTQSTKEVILSPKKPLVADQEGVDVQVYDGKAGYIRLLDRKGADLRDFSKEVIIFIGDGKKLVFKNVIIQNGEFLDSCISLGNNSSYSALEEDGVFLEGQPEKQNDDSQKESVVDGQDENDSNDQAHDEPASELMFDLQAVSPELTFYDSMTKVGDNALRPEKLLRMRMNVFSRLVIKGDDMELNAQVNGLTVEASSGIQVVEPVDIVVKYTNASGKQTMSLASTEIYSNFSYSIIQLILRLQADVMSFLRITSEQVTVECSEFDKVWAENLAEGANCVTFWRPRAPPGFAILGDCMTPRDEVPSKGVIAVNMSMARVKKPVDLILLWSSDQVKRPAEGSEDDDDNPSYCSVWLPVAPPGYVALGCVASTGKRPPPLNTCFCVLSQLVTPCGMNDCVIITGSESQEDLDTQKWSFWRVDNSTGSFFLQGAPGHPQKYRPLELRHVLSNYESFPVQETKPLTTKRSSLKQQSPLQGSPSAERINPLSGLSSGRFYENVARFNLVWWDKNSGSRRGVSIWRPVVPSGCVILGDVAVEGYEPPSIGLVLHDAVERGLLSKPERFMDRGQLPRRRGVGAVSFWLPLAPPGYVALGCVAGTGSSPDPDNLVRCVRSDLVIGSNFSAPSLWETSDTKLRDVELSIWQVENQASSFLVQRGSKHPPKRLALSLADLKKSNAPDNLVIEAEVKQISATVFDDFGGLMAPLVDLSVSGITVSLKGRMEAISSTANFSLSASTFNGKNNFWEPLIESWDGHVRFEYSSDPSDLSRPTESRLRLTASSTLNINISTSNLNMFLEAYSSWNRLNRMEENAKNQLSIDSRGRMKKPALNTNRQRTLSCVNHNELGEELFLRVIENHHAKILSLPSRGTVAVKLPTAQRMQNPGTTNSRRQNQNKIVALRIGNAEVPKDDGIGGREYLVSVRIIPRSQTSDQRQLQYQSARTRCVPPEDGSSSDTVVIHWDEVFIFEVEPEVGNRAEIVVTDLSKGIIVGCCASELLEDADNSSRLNSDKPLGGHIPWHLMVLEWESLYPPEGAESKEVGVQTPLGQISLAKHFFSLIGDPQKERDATGHERGTIQVGPSREGPWNAVGLNYALGPSSMTIYNDIVASEFYVENGVKHLVMRSLVSVKNGTDFDLEVSLAMINILRTAQGTQNSGENDVIGEVVEEEFFENERYQPIVGWGSKWPGHLLPTDPGRYSARDYTNPLKEFPDLKLPLGWEWKSNWHVEKVSGGDQDGWVYGFDFRNIQWPPSNNSEKGHSFVRRRRWLRTRQSTARGGSRVMLGLMKPGHGINVPIGCLRPTSANYCVQIRPTSTSHGLPYEWSQVVPFKGSREGKKQEVLKEISVRSLVETEELLSCTVESSSSTTQNKDLWFCLEATSNVIGKDADLDPIKEWKLVITASIVLRNYLPIPCEYSVSEKSTTTRLVVRDRGVIKPGDSVGIFHVDLRKRIDLTWLPQGGWNPKKETVLISHPYKEPADHMTYVNTRTSRSLQVMIDHGSEEKGVAAKVLQFYVPCWLDSAKCPPLQYRLMEISHRDLEGVKVGNITEQVNFEEKDEYPTMLSDMDPKTMGLSVGINVGNELQFGPVADLLPLDNPDGYLELIGRAESGTLFRFLVSNSACPLDFAKTRVIRIRPYIVFTNRIGEALHLKQEQSDDSRILQASDWRVSFSFPAADGPEILQIKLEGYEWSYPFAVEKETRIVIPLRQNSGERRFIKVDIRGYEEGSRFSIMFRLGSTRGPYRFENRTPDVPLKFRQLGLDDDSWQQLKPHSTKTFAWDDPEGQQLLEVVPANTDCTEFFRYEINNTGDHPELSFGSDLAHQVSVRVIELLEVKTVRFYCKIVELEAISEDEEIEASSPGRGDESGHELARVDDKQGSAQVEVVVNIGKLGVSIIDQHPREILYLSLDNVITSYQIGFGERTSRFKVRIGYLQLDNQLPLSWMPVLLAPERRDEAKEFLMKMSLVMYDDNAETRQVYDYVGLQVESGFRINVHEPIIWAVVDMFNNVHLDRLSDDTSVVQVDPEIRINLIDLSEVRLKLTLETAAGARPRGMLGIWSPLVTTLGNTNKMPIRLGSVLHHKRYMRKSAVTGAIINRIRRDLIHQPLQLLSGVDVLGMTSSTLGTLSQGAAELSKDGKYLRERSAKDRNRNVAGVGDGLLQGTEALARGLGYGISGVITKPITNARQHGFIGFFQGVGKAALGFVMLPVSGLLDFVSLTVNGVGVTCTSCFELFEHEPDFTRRRLPRALRGNSIIFPYNPVEAEGQAILQVAQSKSFYGFKSVFTEAAKFAWSDCYEAHFELPRSKILMLTNRRILMLGRPKSHFQNPDKTFTDPSNILWEITWKNLLAVESHQSSTYGPCLLLHLRKSSKSFARTVKCQSGNADDGISHLHEVSNTIHRLWKEYGPDRKSLEANRRRKYQSGHLSLTPRSKEAEPLRDEGYQERMLKASNAENIAPSPDNFTKDVMLFEHIWISEQQSGGACFTPISSGDLCTIWRPNVAEGYVSVGDVARIGSDPPPVALTYRNENANFVPPLSFNLVWRNWNDGFVIPISIWMPVAPEGYVAIGCVAVADYVEPDKSAAWCVREALTEATTLEEHIIWHAPSNSPWNCFFYAMASESLSFFATREAKRDSNRTYRKVKIPS
ncbi:unnamed protein product [Calypogeia fissa]